VAIRGIKSNCRPIIISVSQGSIMDAILCNVLFNDLDDEAECTLRKFAEGASLAEVDYMPQVCAAIQRDLKRLEIQANRNSMQFKKWKCILQKV